MTKFRCDHPMTPENVRMKRKDGVLRPRCRTCLRASEKRREAKRYPVNFEARWPIVDPEMTQAELIAEAEADLPNVRPAGHKVIRRKWSIEDGALILRGHVLKVNNPVTYNVERFPAEPLVAYARGKEHLLSSKMQQVLSRARREGTITAISADRIAIRLGTHPGLIWPEWWVEAA